MPSCKYTCRRYNAKTPPICKKPPPPPPPPPEEEEPDGLWSLDPREMTSAPMMPQTWTALGDRFDIEDGTDIPMTYMYAGSPVECLNPSQDNVIYSIDLESPADPGVYTLEVSWHYDDEYLRTEIATITVE